MSFDSLESALRRRSDVLYVGVSHGEGPPVVQVLPRGSAELQSFRADVTELCEAHVDGHYVLDLGDERTSARVRLLHVDVAPPDEVAVHLAFGGLCQIGRSGGTDPEAAAAATFDALANLGAPVPFRFEAAAEFAHPVGSGIMVVLGSDGATPRYGVASGDDVALVTARATLDALNRYLSTQSPLARGPR